MGSVSWLFTGRRGIERYAGGGGAMPAVVARLIPGWQANRPLPKEDDYETLITDGYKRNAIIYACIREIATSAAEPSPEGSVLQDGEKVLLDATHPLMELLARPNPEQDFAELLEVIHTHYQATGEWYLHKVRSGANRVVQLWPLRPDRIKPVPDANGIVQGYEYSVGSGSARAIPATDVVAMLNHDPLNDYRGLSPITVAARMGDIDNQAADFVRAFFLNGGMPRGFLKTKITEVQPKERERIRRAYREAYGGADGWGSVGILDGDWDYKAEGANTKDADMGAVFGVSETRLCMIFGVPPILVGARIGLEFATYANYAAARKSFWQETLSPLYRRIAAKLTHGIASEFGNRITLGWNYAGVEALQEAVDARHKRALDGWRDGLLTRNEARSLMGYPRVVDGDVFRATFDAMPEEAIAEEGMSEKRTEAEVLARMLRDELAATAAERQRMLLELRRAA